MIKPLRDAGVQTCGGKAAALAALIRVGLPVPAGFVVPFAAHRIARGMAGLPVPRELRQALDSGLAAMGDVPVAVRSSAATEDIAGGSAAGQYESVLGVRGVNAVAEAVRVCWESASSARAADYWRQVTGEVAGIAPDMAVIVQRLVDADVSGVMFTPIHAGDGTRIEAAWGLGPSVVGGTVDPDTYEVASDGGVQCVVARKAVRLDRDGFAIVARAVPEAERTIPSLDDATASALAGLGRRSAAVFGGPQDIEWAIAEGEIWILQSRPITVPLPLSPSKTPAVDAGTLVGTPGARGTAAGIARILNGPSDFSRVQPGDIVICPYTDPAWTPLFRIAAAIVTETGGVLSHAAIVAREHGLPAVLGVEQATARIRDGGEIAVDGTAGTVQLTPTVQHPKPEES